MTQAPGHPRDADAAEYVLGTLPLAEREAFARALAGDPALQEAVRAWEERLVPLAEAIAPVAPSAALWRTIEGSARPVGPGATVLPWPVDPEVARLRRSRGLWRGAAGLAGALAASLAVWIAADRLTAVPASGLVAVVNRSGELPALIVRVDQRAGTVQVRSISTETPADHSLELWSIAQGQAPRSLGVIRPGAMQVSVPERERAGLPGATLAVSVEPRGGSPTGGPTGQVVYSGRLVAETP